MRRREMSIGEICSRDVVYIEKNESIFKAAQLMRQCHVGDVVITEVREGKLIPIAMLTDRDIVIEVLAEGLEPKEVLVKDIMSQFLVTANENEDLFDVLHKMCNKGVRRLPVVNETEELLGIATVDDIIDVIAEQLTNVAKLISREQRREHIFRDQQPGQV